MKRPDPTRVPSGEKAVHISPRCDSRVQGLGLQVRRTEHGKFRDLRELTLTVDAGQAGPVGLAADQSPRVGLPRNPPQLQAPGGRGCLSH